MLHVYVYYHCLLFQFHVTCLVQYYHCFFFLVLCDIYYHWGFFHSFMLHVLPLGFFSTFYVICITIGPVQDEVCPGPVHELRGVVWIKGSMIEPAHLFYIHSQSTMKKQTDLVPPCHGPTRVHGGFVD